MSKSEVLKALSDLKLEANIPILYECGKNGTEQLNHIEEQYSMVQKELNRLWLLESELNKLEERYMKLKELVAGHNIYISQGLFTNKEWTTK